MPNNGSTAARSTRPPIEAGTCGKRIVASLPLLWAKCVSLHDARGYMHWHTGEVLGPTEREAIRVAMESFTGSGAPARVNQPLQRDRTAVLLRAVDEGEAFVGFVMLVVNDRWLLGKGTAAPDLPVPVIRAVREWGMTLAAAPASAVRTESSYPALTPPQMLTMLEHAPRVDDVSADEFVARLRSFAMELHAQKLTPIQQGARIRRYEILMRAAGEPPPESAPELLIAGARARGLGAVLDRRVVGELLVWLARRSEIWADEPAQFSVNLLTDSLCDLHFVSFFRLCLEKSQLPRSLVAFEVEHEFCQAQPGYLAQLATQLEQAGGGLVIDNFTLSDTSPELLLLPGLRLVKIEPRVTAGLLAHRAGQARVAAIAQMARIAGVHVVAKHIENPEEQALLQVLGVDFIQGYAAAVPAPLGDIDAHREQSLIVDPGVPEEPDTSPVRRLASG
jgi:EAL domain-containing protein (putative c-di-GMP-specific phosphodiesterase class I)